MSKNLLDKLNKFVKTLNIEKEFTQDSVLGTIDTYISQSRDSKPSYKCSLKCVLCEKLIPCTWIGHWQVSNLERHLKSHIKKKDNSFVDAHTQNELNRVLELTIN